MLALKPANNTSDNNTRRSCETLGASPGLGHGVCSFLRARELAGLADKVSDNSAILRVQSRSSGTIRRASTPSRQSRLAVGSLSRIAEKRGTFRVIFYREKLARQRATPEIRPHKFNFTPIRAWDANAR